MREKYLECYARYFVKFLQAYEEEGIPIYAVTPQNETLTDQVGKMPACIWHPETEAKTPDSWIYPLRITDSGSHMSNYPNAEPYLPEGCMISNPEGEKRLILVNPMKTKSQIQFLHDGICWYIELLPNTLATVEF